MADGIQKKLQSELEKYQQVQKGMYKNTAQAMPCCVPANEDLAVVSVNVWTLAVSHLIYYNGLF